MPSTPSEKKSGPGCRCLTQAQRDRLRYWDYVIYWVGYAVDAQEGRHASTGL